MNLLEKLDKPTVIQCLLPVERPARREDVAETPAPAATPERLEATASDGVALCCTVYCGQPEEAHILYFPGEYDSGRDILDLAVGLGQFGITLAAAEYRGCGNSGGEACISALPGDADAVFRALTDWRLTNNRTGPLVIMGRSLGAAVALDCASRHGPDTLTLILESAFDRTGDFLAGKGIADSELDLSQGDPFANREKIKGYEKPALFLHCSRDEITSLSQVEWLVAESRSKATRFQVMPGVGRERIAEACGDLYFTMIRDFINLRMGRRPERKPRRRKTSKC